MANQTVVRN